MRLTYRSESGRGTIKGPDLMRRTALTTLLGATLVLAAVLASGQARAEKNGAQLEMRDMAANVIIIPEARNDIDVRVQYGRRKVPPLMISHRGSTTILNGHIHRPDQLAQEGAPPAREDLPTVFIRVPMDVVIKDSSYAHGVIGASQSLDFIYSGHGDWHSEPIKGNANLIATGTGRFHATSAARFQIDSTGTSAVIIGKTGPLRASLSGSGPLIVEASGDTVLQNSGTGDIDLGTVGNLSVRMFGSGKVNVRRIDGAMTLNNNGSGHLHVETLTGNAELFLSGSGNASIRQGQAPSFVLKGSGSGDVYFGGTAGSVNVNSFGSGDIYIRHATGQVISRVRGSGRAHIGDGTSDASKQPPR